MVTSLVSSNNSSYFETQHSPFRQRAFFSDREFSENDIIKIIRLMTTYVLFGACVFRQTIGIPMNTNCATLFSNLIIRVEQTESYNVRFRYMGDVVSLNN